MRALFLLLAIAFSTTAQAMPFCDAPKPEFDNANGDNLQVWNKRCASVSAAALKIMDQRCGDVPADNKLNPASFRMQNTQRRCGRRCGTRAGA